MNIQRRINDIGIDFVFSSSFCCTVRVVGGFFELTVRACAAATLLLSMFCRGEGCIFP